MQIERYPRCALDIGGTLAKIAILRGHGERYTTEDDTPEEDRVFARVPDVAVSATRVLSFDYFHSRRVDRLLDFLSKHDFLREGEQLHATGGGAYKFSGLLSHCLRSTVMKHDEMTCIMKGLEFLVLNTDSVFRYDEFADAKIPVALNPKSVYPFLVVNIGSGVSILKASGPGQFERITGTCIGGGTAFGLARVLFGATSFEEVVELSETGTDALDLRVQDLLGDSAGSTCIPPETLASSFGRLYTEKHVKVRREDIARSLIHMVAYNAGYLAYLVATIHGVSRIFFSGKFVSNHRIPMASITYGVNFYLRQYHHHLVNEHAATAVPRKRPLRSLAVFPDLSGYGRRTGAAVRRSRSAQPPATRKVPLPPVPRKLDVLFLRHDGYLGALGSWLLSPSDSN